MTSADLTTVSASASAKPRSRILAPCDASRYLTAREANPGCEVGTKVVALYQLYQGVPQVTDDRGLDLQSAGDVTGAVSIVVRGEIDMTTAPKLSEVIDRAIDDGARLVVIKLEHVDFMDSIGLRALIAAADRLNGLEGQLFVDGASAAVSRVLEITGVIERLRAPASEA